METRIFTHRQTSNFTVISNEILQNENMTFFAKGVFVYLLSLPDTWDINVAIISNKFGEKECRIAAAFRELIDLGYCVRRPYRKDGRLKGQKYYISDIKGYFADQTNIAKIENSDPAKITHTENSDPAKKQTSENSEPLLFQSSEKTDPLKNGGSSENKEDIDKNIYLYNKRKKTHFFENEKLKDLGYFLSKFQGAEYDKIDLVYYYHTVGDWSYSSGTKRDENGWIATVRNFIRGDIEKKKLHLKAEYQQTDSRQMNLEGALEYMNL